MSSPNQSHQPSDFWNQQQSTTASNYPDRPIESAETDHARAQAGQGLVITAYILAGIGLLLMVPFPPIGVLLALAGAFIGFRAYRQNKRNSPALFAMIVAAAVGVLNIVMLVAWIGGITQVLQEM